MAIIFLSFVRLLFLFNVEVDGKPLEQVSSLVYLGSVITCDADCKKDVL